MRVTARNGELAEGDRLVWFDAVGIPRRGTVRWIGFLRGHANLYVGVDFDEAIGGGTGMFEGAELFNCAQNHAGLLPISVCMKEEDMDADQVHHQSMEEIDNYDNSQMNFVIGSCVEVIHKKERRYGVIKWIANDTKKTSGYRMVAVEIEGERPPEWRLPDVLESEQILKTCGPIEQITQTVVMVPYCTLKWDERFLVPSIEQDFGTTEKKQSFETNFGSLDSGIEVRQCLPTKNLENLLGRMKGIQGFRNSCYLDATLYAMFVQSTAFDHILRSSISNNLNPLRQEVKDVLKTEIVYPLRRMHFIRADHVLKLRKLLEQLLPEMSGLTTAEKDPEELLNALFGTVLHVEPFLTFRNTVDGKMNAAFICSLITEDLWSGEQHRIISAQSLLERSLFASNIQFATNPRVLIVQIPRYGQQKVFDKIFPSPEMDITHLIHNIKRPCISCGKQAILMCPECFLTKEILIGQVTYCCPCYEEAHIGHDHRPQQLSTEHELIATSSPVVSYRLQLSAVLCIETSHYVAFVRSSNTGKWVFFDSMADRVGLEDGYNVPQVKLCERTSQWLCDLGWSKMRGTIQREGRLPLEVEMDTELMRLLSDCYICFYTEDGSTGAQALSLTRFFT